MRDKYLEVQKPVVESKTESNTSLSSLLPFVSQVYEEKNSSAFVYKTTVIIL
jgi:hypothetical protein